MVDFWKKVIASVLMVFVVSNENCSAGSKTSEGLSKSSQAIDIISNVGWLYAAGRPLIKDIISYYSPESTPTIRNEIMRHPVQRLLFSNTFWFIATACSFGSNLVNRNSSTIAGDMIPTVALILQGGIDVSKIFRRCIKGRINVEQLPFKDHLDYYKRLHPDRYRIGRITDLYRKNVLSSLNEDEIRAERRSTCIAMMRLRSIAELEDENITLTDLIADGVTPTELFLAGAPIQSLIDAGQDTLRLRQSGISTRNLIGADRTVTTLLGDGISIKMFLDDGWTLSQLYRQGIGVRQFLDAGISLLSLYMQAGVSMIDFIGAGVRRADIQQVRAMGRERKIKRAFLEDFDDAVALPEDDLFGGLFN